MYYNLRNKKNYASTLKKNLHYFMTYDNIYNKYTKEISWNNHQ